MITTSDFSWSTFASAFFANGLLLAFVNWFLASRKERKELKREKLQILYTNVADLYSNSQQVFFSFILFLGGNSTLEWADKTLEEAKLSASIKQCQMCATLFLHPLKADWEAFMAVHNQAKEVLHRIRSEAHLGIMPQKTAATSINELSEANKHSQAAFSQFEDAMFRYAKTL